MAHFRYKLFLFLDTSRSVSCGFSIVLLALAEFFIPQNHLKNNTSLLCCLAIVNTLTPTARILGVTGPSLSQSPD